MREWFGAASDVTRSKIAEDALRASEQEFRQMAEAMPQIVWVTRADGFNTFFNQQWVEYTGLSLEESSGYGWSKPFHTEDQSRAQVAWQNAVTTGETYSVEARLRRSDGTYRWWLMRGVPSFAADGNIMKWFGSCTDIHEMKLAEVSLRAAKDHLQTTLNAIPDLLFEVDASGRVLSYRAHRSDLLAAPPEVFMGKLMADVLPAAATEVCMNAMKAAATKGWATGATYSLPLAQGETWFELSAATTPVVGEDAPRFILLARDITERKKVELALKASNAQLQLLEICVSRLNDIVLITEAEPFSEPGPRIVFVNDAFARRTGFSREEVIGKSPRLLQGPKTDRKELDRIRAALERWEPVRAELLNYTKSGEEFWIELDIVPVADATGWFTHWVAVERDVTERKQIQMDLQTSLREKTALLLEVHHRVKKNLQFITSMLRLESFRSTDAPTKSVLQDMQGRVRSMALLHETIDRKGTFAAIDLGSYVGQIASESLKSMQVNSGAVRLQLDVETLQVGLDQATPAGMLISELVSNSLKHAFPAGRTGSIDIALHPLDTSGQWRLRVSDSGIGLPADFEDRRKKSLGLQLAGDMATQMGGTLHIGSGPQVVFTVDFKAVVPAPLKLNLDGAKP